jgi:hypothetical protein
MRTGSRPTAASDQARLLHWRVQRLLCAGFELGLAHQLAREKSVDLHEVLELVDRGCPPCLAARILAPLYLEDRARGGEQPGW